MAAEAFGPWGVQVLLLLQAARGSNTNQLEHSGMTHTTVTYNLKRESWERSTLQEAAQAQKVAEKVRVYLGRNRHITLEVDPSMVVPLSIERVVTNDSSETVNRDYNRVHGFVYRDGIFSPVELKIPVNCIIDAITADRPTSPEKLRKSSSVGNGKIGLHHYNISKDLNPHL